MEKQSLNKEEQKERPLHSSVNILKKQNSILSIEPNKNYLKKRSSSMLNLSVNFVPKLKPIKAIIAPSPINLNQKYSPMPVSELQNTTISTSSFDSQNDSNSKTIKYIYSRRYHPKKSFKFLNIEEETYAISDCENPSKKGLKIYSDSDSSKTDDESDNNLNTLNKNKKIDDYFLNNIKMMRKKMAKIRTNFINNENLLDDSNIDSHFVGKRFNHFKNINQQNCFITNKKKQILNPLKKIKYRTKSFNIKQRYVSTILGFLEKNSSTNSFNSNEK